MPRPSCLTLIAPDILAGAMRGQTHDADAPLLARIAGRGRCIRRWGATAADEARLRPWQRAALATMECDERIHASAPLTAYGMNLGGGADHWIHADAIHLAAGLNEVTLVPLRGEFALTADEAIAMTPVLNEHLSSGGLTIHRTVANGWLLGSSREWKVQTVVADFARDHEWSAVLPQGSDAGELRRLMTELQMLLHDHPVNQRRIARGIPAANAVWFWGNGRIEPHAEPQSAGCAGASDYLRGLCRLHEWAHSNDISVEMLIAHCAEYAHAIGVIEADSLSAYESQWLAPLVTALKQGRFARLRLILDEWQLDIGRWQLRAFWRKDVPVSDWARA